MGRKLESNNQCKFDGCERDAVTRGMCQKHYKRARRVEIKTGTFEPTPERIILDSCLAGGCDRKPDSLGLCAKHYARKRALLAKGEPATLEQISAPRMCETVCRVPGCANMAESDWYCNSHYKKRDRFVKRHGRVPTPEEMVQRLNARPVCKVDGCDKVSTAKGLCQSHYNQWQWRTWPEEWRQGKKQQRRQHRLDNIGRYIQLAKVRASRRRGLIEGLTFVDFSSEDLLQRLEYYGNKCWICNGEIFDDLEWDHVKPVARGGANMLSNLRPAHSECNRRKWATWPFSRDDAWWVKEGLLDAG